MIATAVLAFAGMDAVILFDFMSFGTAFLSLAFFIRIPKAEKEKGEKRESFLKSAGEGLHFLQENRGILGLILFLSGVNLIASVYEAALPAMLLSRAGGGKTALGALNTFTGFASLVGSIFASALPAPKNRVRVICNSLMFSMCTENFFLAFGRSMPVWCFGAVLGWLMIPLMNANLDVLLRIHIPVEMQGRVYSVRNSLQFFTIPVGYLLGGALVDRVFEPFMSLQGPDSVFTALFGTGKGSGAAMLLLIGEFQKVVGFIKFVISGIDKIFLPLWFTVIAVSHHQIPVHIFFHHILWRIERILALTDVFYDGGRYTCLLFYLPECRFFIIFTRFYSSLW